MQRNHSETRTAAHPSPVWETIKWIIAVLAVTSICYSLLTAGGVL